ncbi:phage head morphogenesis protein [Carnimonas bestiolae]|uniref:phage head morphogenesis protein n=1 Tax=Carnimonas bestiolae TaxID=3402172 RepID=UPI003F4A931D
MRYRQSLLGIARQIDRIVRESYDGSNEDEVAQRLNDYADLRLQRWAEGVATNFINGIQERDYKSWLANSERISDELRHQILNTPIGHTIQGMIAEQVELITSLPTEAASRVQRLALKDVVEGSRSSERVKQIMRSGNVSESRARTIARTETGRATGAIRQARSQASGAIGYIWATSHDADVRSSHKALDGKLIFWDQPPTTDGLTYHAGCGPNCRCDMIPVFPGIENPYTHKTYNEQGQIVTAA